MTQSTDPNWKEHLQKKVTVQCCICGVDVQVLVGHAVKVKMHGQNHWCKVCRAEERKRLRKEWDERRRNDPVRYEAKLKQDNERRKRQRREKKISLQDPPVEAPGRGTTQATP